MNYVFQNCINLTSINQFNTPNLIAMPGAFAYCNNLSSSSIQNIINMCLNSSNITTTYKNLSNANSYSPFYRSNITNAKYQNRWSELATAG